LVGTAWDERARLVIVKWKAPVLSVDTAAIRTVAGAGTALSESQNVSSVVPLP
jgi:hypothetical protein